jgi:5-methyltetrahydropteroyltriglutamate--homocysteine methyltransferase
MKPFLTTGIGSMPRRSWLFKNREGLDGKHDHYGKGGEWSLSEDQLKFAQDDATRVAIRIQERAGLDIISDGEQRRKNYVTHLTSNMVGFDYTNLKPKEMRGGRRTLLAGSCVKQIQHQHGIITGDLLFLKSETDKPVKITLPGPMTVVDSTNNQFYSSEKDMAFAWAQAINKEAKLLDAVGVNIIQFDEPAFSRYPEKVEDWGIEALDLCVEGLNCTTAVHVCYGYPQPGLLRPVSDAYNTIIALLDHSKVDQLALEFEGANLDPALLKNCPSKTIIFGCVFNSDEVMEKPSNVAKRLLAAGEYIDPVKIQAAPDCGLVMMNDSAALQKLRILVEGAQIARKTL